MKRLLTFFVFIPFICVAQHNGPYPNGGGGGSATATNINATALYNAGGANVVSNNTYTGSNTYSSVLTATNLGNSFNGTASLTNLWTILVSNGATNYFYYDTTPAQAGNDFSNAIVFANSLYASGYTNTLIKLNAGLFDISTFAVSSALNLNDDISILGSGEYATFLINTNATEGNPWEMGNNSELANMTFVNLNYKGTVTARTNVYVHNISMNGSPNVDGIYLALNYEQTNKFADIDLFSDFDTFNVGVVTGQGRNSRNLLFFYNINFNAISDTNTTSNLGGVVRAWNDGGGSNSTYICYNCNFNAQYNVQGATNVAKQCTGISFGGIATPSTSLYLTQISMYLYNCNLQTSSSQTNPLDIAFFGVGPTIYVDRSTIWNPNKVYWGTNQTSIVYMDGSGYWSNAVYYSTLSLVDTGNLTATNAPTFLATNSGAGITVGVTAPAGFLVVTNAAGVALRIPGY